nr:MAG TPA: hypothetical protein [Caudoviricetes sp.]
MKLKTPSLLWKLIIGVAVFDIILKFATYVLEMISK